MPLKDPNSRVNTISKCNTNPESLSRLEEYLTATLNEAYTSIMNTVDVDNKWFLLKNWIETGMASSKIKKIKSQKNETNRLLSMV